MTWQLEIPINAPQGFSPSLFTSILIGLLLDKYWLVDAGR